MYCYFKYSQFHYFDELSQEIVQIQVNIWWNLSPVSNFAIMFSVKALKSISIIVLDVDITF